MFPPCFNISISYNHIFFSEKICYVLFSHICKNINYGRKRTLARDPNFQNWKTKYWHKSDSIRFFALVSGQWGNILFKIKFQMSRNGLICMVRIYSLKILVGAEINRKLVCSVLVSELKSNLDQYYLKLSFILYFIHLKQPKMHNISSNSF